MNWFIDDCRKCNFLSIPKHSKSILPLLLFLTASLVASASPVLSRISCSSSTFSAAGTDACSVYLTSKATSKFTVSLKSNNLAVKIPSSVVVKSGATTAAFNVTVAAVTTSQTATISAQAGGLASTFTMVLSPSATSVTRGALQSLSCEDYAFTGPQAGTNPCTVTLGSAPNSAETIALTSSTSQIAVPSSVTVAAGAVTASFTAVMNSITTPQIATLTATANGSSVAFNVQLQVGPGTLSINPTAVSFGNVSVGTAVTRSVTLTAGTSPVTVNSASVAGTGFSLLGASFPFTLSPGQTMVGTIQFNPSAVGPVTGQLIVSSNAPTVTVSLSGAGISAPPTVSALTCSSTSITGSLADACTITMSGSAPTGGQTVSLSSSSSAVTLPAAITVPATAASATFTANAACVSSAQTVTLTASTQGSSLAIPVQLNAAHAAMSLNATSIAFGSVDVNTPVVQAITLTSTGSAPLTISSSTVTGAGFSISGSTFPATLNPGESLTVEVQFDPAGAGSFAGQLAVVANAASANVSLSGVGESLQVQLNWSSPPASSDPVVGYNVYRAPSGTTSFQLLNTTIQTPTSFADSTVQSGFDYDYFVKSVDAAGAESTPSNKATVSIP